MQYRFFLSITFHQFENILLSHFNLSKFGIHFIIGGLSQFFLLRAEGRHRRRTLQPTPVFLSGESQGQRSLVGCHLWGCTESDRTQMTLHACMHWRRKWQPTPVFLSGESQGQRSLVGCRLWCRTESHTTEAT